MSTGAVFAPKVAHELAADVLLMAEEEAAKDGGLDELAKACHVEGAHEGVDELLMVAFHAKGCVWLFASVIDGDDDVCAAVEVIVDYFLAQF